MYVVNRLYAIRFTHRIPALGHAVSEETKEKKAWDSNAITPGTPFMDLLASSLRYWVTRKINTDPGWKDVSKIHSP